ncbi:MAG: stage 0 sporulation protein [Christensenellaceae bacterium]|jgi:cell fate regulator YaaT (PSP1 superfamily)|nr:stage 0 sporulation protein [Christensenellaceae bacterium]
MKTTQIKVRDSQVQNFNTDLDLKVGDYVIVETENGAEWGVCLSAPAETKNNNNSLSQILRAADAKDLKTINQIIKSESYAIKTAEELVAKFKLQMKIVAAKYSFDGSKVYIDFLAENRVDFRELVRELASALRCRIEFKQLSARDEVRAMGSIGICGQECCCHRFLKNAGEVSIKMAKNQNLGLNPQKINGQCGRLLCCLGYENAFYEEMNGKMPASGEEVQTPDGRGTVAGTNVVRESVSVRLDGSSPQTRCYKCSEVKCCGGGCRR